MIYCSLTFLSSLLTVIQNGQTHCRDSINLDSEEKLKETWQGLPDRSNQSQLQVSLPWVLRVLGFYMVTQSNHPSPVHGVTKCWTDYMLGKYKRIQTELNGLYLTAGQKLPLENKSHSHSLYSSVRPGVAPPEAPIKNRQHPISCKAALPSC